MSFTVLGVVLLLHFVGPSALLDFDSPTSVSISRMASNVSCIASIFVFLHYESITLVVPASGQLNGLNFYIMMALGHGDLFLSHTAPLQDRQ